MTGGGSQVQAATPWGAAQPYLTDIMSQAKGLYGSQAPFYTNPAANFGYGQVTGAVGNAIGGTTPFGSMASGVAPGTTAAINSELSGQPDYTAVKGALDAANQQTWDSLNNQLVPQLNQNASFLGNPSGSIKDLNWAVANIGKNMDLNAQQQYLGQYDLAKQQQSQAAGLGANIAQGAGNQSLQGAGLFGSIAQLPQANLGDYANIVSGTGGKFGTSTLTNNPSGAATAANIIGGLTAGAGLFNSLTGTPVSSGIPGAVGSLFGSGALPSTAGAAAGATDAIGATAGAQMAGTAGDVAAANDAWLAGQGASAGLGAGAGAGAAADAAGAGAAGAGAAGAAAGEGAADLGAAGAAGATDAAAGSGAVAGSLGLGLAGAGLALAPLIYGMSQKPVKLDASWYQRANQALSSGPGTTPAQQGQYWGAVTQLMGMTNDPQAQAMLQKYGISFPQTTGQGASVTRVGNPISGRM